MIDLHLHTTASDGALQPSELIARAAAAGITTLSVTDHDTMAGLAEASAAATRHGLTLVNGIEITAVEDGHDVHVLGYFFDPASASLAEFLGYQRDDRLRRVREMAARLEGLGAPIEVEPILRQTAASGRSVGRPHVAAALLAAGHVASHDEAFERFLGRSAPAFVPRRGAEVAAVIEIVQMAGGLASLAHPGLTHVDDRIGAFARAGLAAVEAFHSDHDAATEAHYRKVASSLGLAVSGGSDFHADDGHHRCRLGSVALPAAEFAQLEARRR